MADDHLSGMPVTRHLARPTRESNETGRLSSPIWPCTGWGLPCRLCRQTRGELLPRLFTLTCTPAMKEKIKDIKIKEATVRIFFYLFTFYFYLVFQGPSAVYFLWRFPSLSGLGVTQHPALRSSDFPHPLRARSSGLLRTHFLNTMNNA